jgi:hypothetical protein
MRLFFDLNSKKEEKLSRRDLLIGLSVAGAVTLPMLSPPARAAVSMLRTGLDPKLVDIQSELIPAKRGGGGKGGGGKGRGGRGGHKGGGGHGKGGHGRSRGHGGSRSRSHSRGHDGRHSRGHRHGGGGRWWRGRWYAWGGPCWQWSSPVGWIWVCH